MTSFFELGDVARQGGALSGLGSARVLPLAGLHIELGCHPAPAHGYTLPLWYQGVVDEQISTREGAGLFDRSHLGRFYVTGERAAEVLASVLATDVRGLPVGAVTRAVALHEDGAILDLPTLAHLDQGRWLLVTGPSAGDHLAEHLEAAGAHLGVLANDRSAVTALVALEGPRALDVAGELFGPSFIEAVPREHARELLLGAHRAALLRTSQLGEDGLWLLMNPEDAAEIWRGLIDAGATSAGLAAHDVLRLEAGALEAPLDTPRPATPAAAGLEALVSFEAADGMPRAFPGAEALRAAGPPGRRATGLLLEGPRLARRGSRVRLERSPAGTGDIGACVAAAFSATLGRGIALAYLAPGLTRVEVDTDGAWQPAEVTALPFLPPR